MSLTRRDCLRLVAAGGLAASATGCGRVLRAAAPRAKPAPLPLGEVRPVARLLNRLAFGPAPGDPARVEAEGVEAYVERQLAADAPEGVELQMRLARLDPLSLDAMELSDLPENAVVRQMQQAALLRAVYSPNQLRERMVDLWSNHFNVYARKHYGAYYMAVDQAKVVREHALGTFPDLLRASAHSPAMLNYLDNQVNRRGVPNENYARELMELHTLGVHGGYTQRDVQEVARCLTGWTIENRFLRPKGRFRFDPDLHDNRPKVVLGHKISPVENPAAEVEWRGQKVIAGQLAGERVLDILTSHPQTARFVATKLVRYFLGHEDPVWIKRTAEVYTRTGGDIRAMVRPILLSPALIEAPKILRRPYDFVASALRAVEAETDCGPAVLSHLDKMGQGLYEWPMPDGYPDKTSAWTGSMLARWNFAFALAADGLRGTRVDWDRFEAGEAPADAVVQRFFAAHPRDVAALHASLGRRAASAPRGRAGREAAALAMASPEFQWR